MPILRSFNAKAIEPGGLFQEQHQDYDHTNEMRAIKINWDRLMVKRYQVMRSTEDMTSNLLKQEVNRLLDLEVDPQYRLLIDLLWSTGGRVSEVLALTKERFAYDGYDFQVVLQTLKSPGRPIKKAERSSAKRFIPI